ncbi:MAG: NfeD family protein [Ruminococcus sp.]|nr:NfeD family protein [Ruminococcus sp.]
MPSFIADLSSTAMMVIWAVAFVFFLIVEASTAALVSVWFAAGALVSLFFAIAKTSFLTQCIVFVVTSVVVLILTRPLAKKINDKKVPTNYELDVGKTAQVIEQIDNVKNTGRVKLDGTFWSARSESGDVIGEGLDVEVRKVDGSKLVVCKKY